MSGHLLTGSLIADRQAKRQKEFRRGLHLYQIGLALGIIWKVTKWVLVFFLIGALTLGKVLLVGAYGKR